MIKDGAGGANTLTGLAFKKYKLYVDRKVLFLIKVLKAL